MPAVERPVELFRSILELVDDLTVLWTICRPVSKQWTQIVEEIFIEKHIRKTWFRIDGGKWRPRKYGRVMLSATFAFDRFDGSNPSRAIFSDKGCESRFFDKLCERVRDKMEYGNPAYSPNVIIQVRRMVNDTAVPGLEFDFEKLEMSFDWNRMYSAFFKEEAELERRQDKWLSRPELQDTIIPKLQEQVQREELRQQDALKHMYEQTLGRIPEIRKTLRRERIYREILESDGVQWTWEDDHDQKDLEKLDQERYAASIEDPFSDESDTDDDMEIDDDNMDVDAEEDDP
ncbi:hypothetical protein D9615_006853 [Tricholomella constricta]|uniref:F-box domain-containing protein n=1 Tax=Tricholomella constricta TaxID=117010 RepID=A0A8H5H900_9AGAR|nr:hypothetical protein D9615_006853 [Tricholomella constricta]